MLKQNKPALIYMGALLSLHLLVCFGVPLYEELKYSENLFAIPLYYLLQLLSWLSPVLMMGVLGYTLCKKQAVSSLFPFFYYVFLNLIFQIPAAFLSEEGVSDSPLLNVLLLSLNSLFSSLCFFGVLVLAYLLFIRNKKPLHFDTLIATRDTAFRFLGFTVLLHTAYQVILETVDFITYLNDKLFLGTLADFTDFFAAFLLYCLFGAISLIFARLLQNAFFKNDAR
ncbi:MAG: hypothetical protein J6K61_06460 [Clostridia bacterium]|nr:hypothetical protein [Clostridia bacterium]